MNKVLKPEFFDRSSIIVAEDLLGKYIVRDFDGESLAFKIIETEAYEGLEDKASHAHRGKTLGNAPMFSDPGTIYVYFTYGMHWMLNITCGKRDYPAAVLLRGVLGVSGPARLTKKLKVDKSLNNKIISRDIGLWFEERGGLSNKGEKLKIVKTPRIGIDSSGPVWSKKLYRFVLV